MKLPTLLRSTIGALLEFLRYLQAVSDQAFQCGTPQRTAALRRVGRQRLHVLLWGVSASALLLATSIAWAGVVTTLADSGPGSFAPSYSRREPGRSRYTYHVQRIGGILLASQLPAMTGAGDSIDGSGASVVIDGSGLTGTEIGLRIRASDITVRRLTVQNFPNDGIRVDTQGSSTTVTNVLIDANTVLRNGNRGIRVSGGVGPSKTVSAQVTDNIVSDSAVSGILVVGNSQDIGSGDLGGNQVTALVDGNIVRRSKQGKSNAGLGGDGIIIVGGTRDGSNNIVTATVSFNQVNENRDDGIVVVGCGCKTREPTIPSLLRS